jgi:hypothetical protein
MAGSLQNLDVKLFYPWAEIYNRAFTPLMWHRSSRRNIAQVEDHINIRRIYSYVAYSATEDWKKLEHYERMANKPFSENRSKQQSAYIASLTYCPLDHQQG